MTTESKVKEIRDKFVEKSNKAKADSYKSHVLGSLTPADQAAIKAIAAIDDSSGGQIQRLVSVYLYIKKSS